MSMDQNLIDATGAEIALKSATGVVGPAQEPVAWQWLGSAHFRKKLPKNADITAWNPLYTAPPQSEWNAALDEAASCIGEIKAFGQATQDSFAAFIKGLKK